ncbi:MFS transporter [Microbacterium sp. SORGH_AS_0888]|uniref:MFS transporter n=1 Tax=Microbacterium sp. SORGH_AS_0888 TaxID=3041791 RepID=UPI00278B2FC9|nr:MFS transporter [Microbacterium sp. SORGH_AS_0888]MDQ1131122.1 YNFM family putative membrane transporter [Microbacterium sp. SORGH_AS_0888]
MTEFAGHRPGEPAYRRLIAGLFFAGVATFAQLYSPQAVLPFLAADLGVSPATAALAVSAATLGLALAVIPWSMVADRRGRRPTMAIGVVAATAIGLLAPLAPTMELFLIARLVEGAALGAVPAVALAYLSEEVHAGHAARAAGSYIAGTTVGGLAGRLISGPFGEAGHWRLGVFIVAAVCAASAVLFLWLAPRARGFAASPVRVGTVLRRLATNLRSRVQLALYAQAFLLMGAFVAVYNYVGFLLAAPPYLVPQWTVSLLFLAYLAGTVSSPRAGALAGRFGRLPVLLGSAGVMAGGALLLLVPSVGAVVAGLVIFTAGFFAAHAVASGWTPASAPAGSAAQASSLYYLAYYAGSSALGWALGLVFAGVGWVGVAGVVVLLCAIAAAWAQRVLRDPAARSGTD